MALDIALNNIGRYGQYPSAMTFANNDNVADLADSTKPAYSAAFDAQDGIKRHAACDECRMQFQDVCAPNYLTLSRQEETEVFR